ncbi:hypothetical protein I4U23_022760 [Adineta vaga]|nr:hypothetical protein I4U23_022760 [Adineta vaga]
MQKTLSIVSDDILNLTVLSNNTCNMYCDNIFGDSSSEYKFKCGSKNDTHIWAVYGLDDICPANSVYVKELKGCMHLSRIWWDTCEPKGKTYIFDGRIAWNSFLGIINSLLSRDSSIQVTFINASIVNPLWICSSDRLNYFPRKDADVDIVTCPYNKLKNGCLRRIEYSDESSYQLCITYSTGANPTSVRLGYSRSYTYSTKYTQHQCPMNWLDLNNNYTSKTIQEAKASCNTDATENDYVINKAEEISDAKDEHHNKLHEDEVVRYSAQWQVRLGFFLLDTNISNSNVSTRSDLNNTHSSINEFQMIDAGSNYSCLVFTRSTTEHIEIDVLKKTSISSCSDPRRTLCKTKSIIGYNTLSGCFQKPLTTGLPSIISNHLTHQLCIASCRNLEAKLAIFQMNRCYCLNAGTIWLNKTSPIHSKYKKGHCGRPCPGDKREHCGDENTIIVHNITQYLSSYKSSLPTESNPPFKLFGRDDFKEVWRQIPSDIKIRKYIKVRRDLPEIRNLSSRIQDEIYYQLMWYYSTKEKKTGWEYFNIKLCKNCYKISWVNSDSCGVGIVVLYYFSAAATKYVLSVIGYISQNKNTLRDALIKYTGVILSAATFYAFKRWLMNDHCEWNILIAACILKKLKSSLVATKPDENAFLSPYSISLALSMVAAGARGQTEKGLLNLLQIPSRDKLDSSVKQLMDVTRLPQIKLANRLYPDKKFSILPAFKQRLQNLYNITLSSVDLNAKDLMPVLDEINAWVSNQTNGHIKQTLDKKDLATNNTTKNALLMINCLVFDEKWQNEFRAQDTNDGCSFFPDNGPPQENILTMMKQQGHFPYVDLTSAIGARMIHLPFENNDLTFTIVLPNNGVKLSDVESKLTSSLLNSPTNTNQKVFVWIPKWKFESESNIESVLKTDMNVTDMFNEKKANLEGISLEKPIAVSNLIHKTYVIVDEKGVRAAATSVVRIILEGSGAPEETVDFICNKPFLYAIRYKQTTLFMGRYTKVIDISNMPPMIDGKNSYA